MNDVVRSLTAWATFAGGVLVIAVLYWAQAVLVPFALAVLLTFVLTPPVSWLERWVGRVAAVLVAVTIVFATLGLAGWALSRQADELAASLPGYRANIRAKIADVRGASKGGTVEKIQETIEGIRTDLGAETPAGTPSRPVVVTSTPSTGFPGFTWLGPIVGPLGTAGLVAALVIFMLLERRELRDRLIGLIGGGRLATTTRAFDEAARRVSRQLLMQSLVSVLWGAMALTVLYLLHVPYALVFAALGAALRFIPYVGPIVGAGAPVLVSLAALEGWVGPLTVLGLFVALELFTNLVLETVLYAGAVGVSQVALLVSVAFWTWLWGPLGLLMASPLTVCLVVIGKHVPGLAFIGMLIADTGVLAEDAGYYQRLLARDQGEAAEMIDRHIASGPPESVFDALMLPALGYAERDRIEERLSQDEEAAIIEATRELLADAVEGMRRDAARAAVAAQAPAPPATSGDVVPATQQAPIAVLGYAVNGPADEVALAMLAELCAGLPLRVEITRTRMLAAELIALVREGPFSIVCFADLPPSPSSKTRYLVKRLRSALPEVRIAVGRWGPAVLADEGGEALLRAGASHLASTLIDSRDYLRGLTADAPG
ncbi:ABC transporter permease [Luteitalea sp. TBR-22]|uniref:AI-2E family transporter n=1 Tax=Luteitalea sp. TBR-22 TaxID=2802971 RepID=UPI001AF0FE71|nr:AI-2E family transporter [Luteitalea sp. TBR-22]BCS34024.1 ABC transporter permease [Luteitalea sp. TBR-22]